jgi:hypothetical protein
MPDAPANSSIGVPTWFWGVSVLALLWNLIGVAAFAMQMMMTQESIAALPAEQQTVYRETPVWANVAFAVAVFGGVLGCLGLLMRKRWATALLIASLIGVLVQHVYPFLLANVMAIMGPTVALFPMILILLGLAQIWFSRKAAASGWLR